MRDNLLNFLLYQAGWFACVLGGSWGRPWWAAGAAVAMALAGLHVALAKDRRTELTLMLTAAGIGAVVDSLQAAAGLLVYASGQTVPWLAPVWDVVLWFQLATLLRFAMGWTGRRLRLAAALGATGGPLAFLAGERLGAVAFHPWPWLSLVVLSVVWAAAFPLLVWLAGRRGEMPGRYRFSS